MGKYPMYPDYIKQVCKYNQKGIYHPYKKQNKHWIVIIMDETLSDEEIMELVAIGYENSCK